MEVFQTLTIFSVGFLGACLGSFAYVLSTRLHIGQHIARGRSKCASCARTLSFSDLIPIFSFLLLRGRCRTCGSVLNPMYFFVELFTALLFVIFLFAFGITLALIPALLSGVFLVALLAYDIRHTVIPDVLVWSFTLLAFLTALLFTTSPSHLFATVIVALGIAAALGAIWFLSKGRAIGLGDAKLALGLSLLVGYPASISGIVLSFWVGAVVGLALLVLLPEKFQRKTEIPFAPFLIIGFLIPLAFGWNLPLGL